MAIEAQYTHERSPDGQAIVLLCAGLGAKGDRPLKPTEYHKLAVWLHQSGARPVDLLAGPSAKTLIAQSPIDPTRLETLLARRALLAMKVEEWAQRGIWVITRADSAYPASYRNKFLGSTPPVLYGAGPVSLLETSGIGVVGSRDVDEAGSLFARKLAMRCAEAGVPVVSGGARGVDEEAMLAALSAGGTAVGILAADLGRTVLAKKYRQALVEQRLTLVSPYDPQAGFSVGNAMGRNRLIYALSGAVVVVSSAFESGGTWQGAVENQFHGWAPCWVRDELGVPEGNTALIAQGARALAPPELERENLVTQLRVATPSAGRASVVVETDSVRGSQLSLFGNSSGS